MLKIQSIFTPLKSAIIKTQASNISNTSVLFQKLYVGNLTWTASEENLKTLFSKHGQVVDSFIVRDRLTGKSRGFGFITFSSSEESEAAKESLNGFTHEGRALRVNDAEEKVRPSQAASNSY